MAQAVELRADGRHRGFEAFGDGIDRLVGEIASLQQLPITGGMLVDAAFEKCHRFGTMPLVILPFGGEVFHDIGMQRLHQAPRTIFATQMAPQLVSRDSVDPRPEIAVHVKGFQSGENRHENLLRDVLRRVKIPDMPGQNTSDHGWNLDIENRKKLKPIITKLKDCGIRVSLFMDPHPEEIKAAANLGTDRVELYTEPYAAAFRKNTALEDTLQKYVMAAKTALDAGLDLNAGHDLNLQNLELLVRTVPGILEVSIGHALIAEALKFGLEKVVKDYLKILSAI